MIDEIETETIESSEALRERLLGENAEQQRSERQRESEAMAEWRRLHAELGELQAHNRLTPARQQEIAQRLSVLGDVPRQVRARLMTLQREAEALGNYQTPELVALRINEAGARQRQAELQWSAAYQRVRKATEAFQSLLAERADLPLRHAAQELCAALEAIGRQPDALTAAVAHGDLAD